MQRVLFDRHTHREFAVMRITKGIAFTKPDKSNETDRERISKIEQISHCSERAVGSRRHARYPCTNAAQDRRVVGPSGFK